MLRSCSCELWQYLACNRLHGFPKFFGDAQLAIRFNAGNPKQRSECFDSAVVTAPQQVESTVIFIMTASGAQFSQMA